MSGKKCDKCGGAYAGFGTSCSTCRKTKAGAGANTGVADVAGTGSRNDVCAACGKAAYAMERIQVEGETLHPCCFKCVHCNGKLPVGDFAKSQDGKYYCKTHYIALFKVAGRYAGTTLQGPPSAIEAAPIHVDDSNGSVAPALEQWAAISALDAGSKVTEPPAFSQDISDARSEFGDSSPIYVEGHEKQHS